MENKKRVYCLYRVSKQIQVDKENDDIPMQKQACHEFAERHGWEVVKEFYEKGVSGFKVSSTKRDAILEIQREAALGNFDILLVFMFDRLGRRDDETPFVVEWFIRNNIAVWSVNEGEQRLDSHVDKLLNYIRYWQASGESIKSSVRIKTRIAQIAGEGYYTGGKAPFGYRLVKSGRFNDKKGIEVLDYVVCDDEVDMVKTIFNKYVNEGYGCQRLADYLYAQGVVKPNGKPFSPLNVVRTVQNEIYIGYLKRGETRAFVPALKIVDDDIFNRAQAMRDMRNPKKHSARRIPMTTKGNALLSGNIFCGHCGRRLSFSDSRVKSQKKANGNEIQYYSGAGYVCNYGSRLGGRTCQSRYLSKRVDDAVRSVLKQIFEKIQDTPPADYWERQHERTLSELHGRIKTVAQRITKLNKDLATYKSEVINVLQGNSAFTAEILNQLIHDTDAEVVKQTEERERLQSELSEIDTLYEETKAEHMRIRSWCEIFDDSSIETQKMVASNLISEVRLWKGYQIEIELNLSVKEFVDSISFDYEKVNVSVDTNESIVPHLPYEEVDDCGE